ncbi:MAG: NADH-quinone oxidoreductase subunit NuoH [Bifidobacteriaceae bacterium]|nr:NADH-quinone oxidoreductase subunit NuoH [Bifidobacteriaceae bacterium]
MTPETVDQVVGADFSADNGWIVAVKAVLILVFALVSVLFALWFERRLVARMQSRLGPNVRGPLGLFQAVYDAMKLLLKEDINVSRADKAVYIIAPMISVFASLMVFAVIPMGGMVPIPFTDRTTPLQLTDFPVAVLYILAITAIGVYGIVLGGWSSRSTYALLGSVRSTAQVISYELAMGMSLVTVFIFAGSMSTSVIVGAQAKLWYAVMLAPSFIIYLVSMIGETNRLPFDLPEAEGELVSGYMTEYSSMKFAWYFLAEYINMLNVSAVATTLFLGGWRAPWPLSLIGDGVLNTGWWTFAWFLIKVWLLMFLFVWVRGTLVRFRYDQFMRLGWKALLPAALVWIGLLTLIRSVEVFGARPFRGYFMPLVSAIVIIYMIMRYWPESRREEPEPPPPFEPFAGGFPVPPLPGQALAAQPGTAQTALAVQAVVVAEEFDDGSEPAPGAGAEPAPDGGAESASDDGAEPASDGGAQAEPGQPATAAPGGSAGGESTQGGDK